jgi:cytochrome c oxidase subunit III
VKPKAIDVSHLQTYGFGHRSLVWWGTFGIIAVEGSVFAMMIMSYLYLKGRVPNWPPAAFPPDLLWGTLNTAILVASVVPAQITKSAAERLDLRKARLWLWISLAFGLAFSVVRVLEFTTLNVWWDDNAYGSVVWTLLGLHTAHIVTDVVDSLVLGVLLFTGPLSPTKFVDVSENSLYWYFVVISWLPIYAVIYLAPRFA